MLTIEGTSEFGAVDLSQVMTLLQKAPQYVEQIVKLSGQISQYMDIVQNVLEDPALPQVVGRVRTIRQIEEQTAAKTPAVPGTPKPPVGLGLKNFVKPLDAYIYYRKNKWVLPVGVAAAFLIPLGFGVLLGRAIR